MYIKQALFDCFLVNFAEEDTYNRAILSWKSSTFCFRPGGELNSGEDEVEGLKRLLAEVIELFLFSPFQYFLSILWLLQ